MGSAVNTPPVRCEMSVSSFRAVCVLNWALGGRAGAVHLHVCASGTEQQKRKFAVSKGPVMLPKRPSLLTDPEGLRGVELLNNRVYNKSTAFTKEEREALGLRGLLPARVSTLETQLARTYGNICRMPSAIDKYIFLQLLEDRNQTLFYALLLEHLEELMPIVYTPTVGQACTEYGALFRRPKGLYVSLEDRGRVSECLANWWTNDVRAVVVTDGARILGLGDLGCNGMPIPVGKLMLFAACGGVVPATCMPALLDVGTNNEKLLNDPLYPGLPIRRVKGTDYLTLVDEFITEVTARYPHVLVQFEDFGNDSAFHILERYREKICCFNDDIQGTAAVTLAGILSAVRLKSEKVQDQTILFMGAGEAARGIADLVVAAMVREGGISQEEAIRRCFLFDSKGLVVRERAEGMQEHKLKYAHEGVPFIGDWAKCIQHLRPSAIIGVSGHGESFTEESVRLMASLNEWPIIFPLSNPTSHAECTAQQAFDWTNGRVLFASGSPFDHIKVRDGNRFCPSQANNVYVFPGVSQGVVLSRSKHVTDEMFLAAADTIVECVTPMELAEGRLFPSVSRIREISELIAARVVDIAVERGIAQISRPDDTRALVRSNMYSPHYPSLV